MAESIGQFGIVDYVVLCCMLLISVAIGIYQGCVGGKQKTNDEFLLGNRNMNPIAVAMSFAASFVSSLTVLGIPSEVYIHGISWWLNIPALLCAGLFVSRFVIPIFFRLNVISAYEYLELRFNKAVRLCGLFSFVTWMLLYMGVVMYGPALALNVVTGVSLWGSILATGLSCTLYTTIGGMKAVIWTDVFQMTTIFVGMLCALIEGLRRIGSFEKIWQTGMEKDRVVINFSPDPTIRHTFWTVFVGGLFFWTTIYAANQTMVQRYLTLKTETKAKLSVLVGVVGVASIFTIAVLAGLTIFTFYSGCDPLTDGKISKQDQIIVYFIMDVFADLPGIPGLFVASLYGATLSTVSSGLNALAAVTTQDIVVPIFKGMNERRLTTLTKAFALMYGLIAVLSSYVISLAGSGLLKFAFNVFGLFGGPVLGLFCLGIFFTWSNSKGAICGYLCGFGLMIWIVIGTLQYPPLASKPPLSVDECIVSAALNVTTDVMMTTGRDMTALSTMIPVPVVPVSRPMITQLYNVSYAWYSCIACCTTVVIGLLVSFITGPTKARDLDPKLFMSAADAMYCCFPESCKRVFRCGVPRYLNVNTNGDVMEMNEISVSELR